MLIGQKESGIQKHTGVKTSVTSSLGILQYDPCLILLFSFIFQESHAILHESLTLLLLWQAIDMSYHVTSNEKVQISLFQYFDLEPLFLVIFPFA